MRPFNQDLEISNIFNDNVEKYYDLFSIGITTTYGRFNYADLLIKQLNEITNIPIHVIINDSKNKPIPTSWPIQTQVTTEPKPVTWCRNQHCFFYPNRPYIIWFDDDAFITHLKAIDNLLAAHLHTKFDIIRAFHNGCCLSMSKKLLAQLLWWDERFYYGDDDTDLHMRMERDRCAKKLEHNKARFVDNLIVGRGYAQWNPFRQNTEKYPGRAILTKKWGLLQQPQNEEENINIKQLLPDINLYPEYYDKFIQFKDTKEYFE